MKNAWTAWCGRILLVSWLGAGTGCGAPSELSDAQALGSAQQAVTSVYEAESAALSGGAIVATDHTGYSGTGFVGGFTDTNKGNAAAQFTVSASSAANYDVVLRYANGSTITQTLSLYVDGTKVKQLSLSATANWNTWATRTDTLSLSAGAHTLRYKFDTTDSGNVNVDSISLSAQADPPPSGSGPLYEAESAALSGGAALATDHTGYSGTGFVGGFTDANKGNAAVQFTVSASTTANYDVALRYANGSTITQTLSLYVDGTKVKQLSLAATSNWDAWATRTDTLSLGAGSHTLRYKFDTTDSGNVNLDSINVSVQTSPPPPGSGPLYEAESASLSGGASVATDHTGYSGTGFVGGFTDANKGNAAVQFTVSASTTANYDVALRYANGTGVAETLSLYVDGTKVGQTSLGATSSWDTWGTRIDTVSLSAGTHTLRYKFDTTDSGNVNLDSITLSDPIVPPPDPPPPPAGSGFVYQAEDQFFSGGVAREPAYLRNFSAAGARVIFTVNTDSTAATSVGLRYLNGSGTSKTLNVYVNGLYVLTTTLPNTGSTTWSGKTETLSLRRGLNTISYQYDAGNSGGVLIDALTVVNGNALATRGATLPYQELEAEAGTTNAQVLPPNRTTGTVEAESSGRRAVKLTLTGQYVQWTAPQAANSLVIRYSMPDASAGGGIDATLSLYVNGTKIQALSLTSRYAWIYGGYPYGDSPSTPHKPGEWDPGPHRFYDESRFLLPSIPAGATVKLQKDSGDTAASYTIDLIDLEQVDAALTMPANFVSITDFGAIADDTGDDFQAIQNAINSAKSSGKGVWIPSGVFRMSNRVNVDNVQVRGAGPWYTRLQGVSGKGGFYGTGSNVKVLDLAFFNDSVQRNDSADHAAFEGNFGTGSLIQNVWIEHAKVGMWLSPGTDGLYVVNGRIRDTFADGINIYGGVKNTTVSHFNNRNTGDDAFAMWSDGSLNDTCVFRYDTAQNPNLANTFAIYNGKDNKVLDSVASDTLYGASAGVFLSNWFSALPFTGTTEVRRVTMNRTSGYSPPADWDMPTGGLFILAATQSISGQILVDGVEINDSTYSGIKLAFGKGPNQSPPANNTYSISPVSVSNVTIQGAGSYGLEFYNVLGTGNFSSVSVTGASLGGLSNPNSKYTVVRGSGNSGW